ncbi:hypothetical protein [Kaistella palustris]|uniref:hypothetical protein n=1 Tax=Kaistella palustris TaxID=493376 RepID=UPI0003F86EA0|nr:hypothetical protein [Kaistella palustris]
MKNLFFSFFLILFAVLSCRNTDDGIQRIDQILNLYIDSAGQDMLNSKIPGSYSNIRWNDIYGLTDNAPVSFTTKKDADTLTYLEYLAGAKRKLIDSAGVTKTYESRIALALTRKVTDSTTSVANDTMTIQYTATPELFQISKVFYNGILQFTKAGTEPNTIKIQK